MVEEALLDLQQHPDTPTDDRNRLLLLSLHLKSHPPHISVGGMGGLGSSTLVVLVNVALTYSAILFQYRPEERSRKEHWYFPNLVISPSLSIGLFLSFSLFWSMYSHMKFQSAVVAGDGGVTNEIESRIRSI